MAAQALAEDQRSELEGLRRVERILGPAGLFLGVASAGYTWWRSGSVWLGFFAFVMVSRFISGGLPKIIFHDRPFKRTLFYLLWPVGGGLILYGVHALLGIMWLAVILGLVGGVFVSIFVGALFFRDVATEDQARENSVTEFKIAEGAAGDAAGAAMKARFTAAEWDELKRLPMMAFMFVAGVDGDVSKAEIQAWTDFLTQTDDISDPILRTLARELNESFLRLGGNDPVRQMMLGFSEKRLSQAMDSASGKGEYLLGSPFDLSIGQPGELHALVLLERELSPDEFRSFGQGLTSVALKVAMADGNPSKEQMEIVFKLVPSSTPEDLLSNLGIDGSAGS